ncbi:MAG: phospho-N-acetylmuramoyl-pentapeptide-transferase [Candidatus Saccharibacteria bacterium]|nr:phospho-N-acetylmuramoyl-pentapeptide-transferase [Candidatus Saccharibacteria bacterium]
MNDALRLLTSEMTHIFILSVTAFVLAMLLTPVYTFFAYRYRFWKRQRSASTDGKELKVFTKLHAAKFRRNIPTMAGIIGVASVTMVTLLWNLDRAQTWLPLAALIGGGAVGLIDDIINIRGDGSGVAGLRSPVKFALVTLLGVVLGWFFFAKLGVDAFHVPFVGSVHIGWLIVPLFAFAVVATGNAVNISDGLDGLAGGLLIISFATFGVIAMLQGNVLMAGFCFTVVGVLLSYLWFNIYPARFFMGDVGSFAYGAALGVVAMLTNTLLLLPVIGLLFVVEAGSSAVQIVSKKFFGRKVFISAPIHHHLEAKGWPEVKVTMRFWVIACVMAFIGFLLALSGGYIA